MDRDLFEKVMERLKTALAVSEDKELAEVLGMKPNAYGNRKMTGSLPIEYMIRVARARRIDLGWVLLGEGRLAQSAAEPPAVYAAPSDTTEADRVLLRTWHLLLSPEREALAEALVAAAQRSQGAIEECAQRFGVDVEQVDVWAVTVNQLGVERRRAHHPIGFPDRRRAQN